jgi:ferrous iron transport protein B
MIAVRTPLVALVGNPNTGKTTLFNALAGMKQQVGNYPGVTVESKKGKLHFHGQTIEIIDLPGTYSLAARSPDEMLAVDVILGHQGSERPDAVIVIVDASVLERNLYLATQVLELGIPVVLALNMIDVAEGQGVKIDVQRLSANLGIPVVPMQANKGKGLEQLKQAINDQIVVKAASFDVGTVKAGSFDNDAATQKFPEFPPAFENEVAGLSQRFAGEVPAFLLRRLLLDVGGYVESVLVRQHGPTLAAEIKAARARLTQANCPVPAIEARTRYGWIHKATADCLQRPKQRVVSLTDRLDRVLTHKVWGTLIFLLLMFAVFESLFVLAPPLMDYLKKGLNFFADLVKLGLPPGPLRSLVVEGIFKGVGSVLVFLPQIMMLFAFVAVLEDCGYMARAAFLMDRLMSRAGLSGKSFIPLLSSVACAVPGIMAARVIENRRDRLATILVAPLMSCSARLPVYLLLIGVILSAGGYPPWVQGLTLFGLYCIGLVVAPLVAFLLKRTLLRGETPAFVMEMPLYKLPSLRLIVRRSFDSGWMFVKRAGTLILATMIVVWALLYFPGGQEYEAKIDKVEEAIGQKEQEAKKLQMAKNELQEFQKLAKLKALSAFAEDHRQEFQWSDEKRQEQADVLSRLQILEDEIDAQKKTANEIRSEWKGQSYLGQMGKFIEPAVEPLGWDWRIGMAALASFPAREVMVGTLGIIFSEGEGESDDEAFRVGLGKTLENTRRDGQPDRKVFTVPVALSVLVFFALCCQCASTLAVIRRETNSWRWPVFTFVYMTVLAYAGAFIVYQISNLLV